MTELTEERVRELRTHAETKVALGFTNTAKDVLALCDFWLSARLTAEDREALEMGVRALQRDINFAHEMAGNWLQKGPFSSVDKGKAALEYVQRCENSAARLRALAKDAQGEREGVRR